MKKRQPDYEAQEKIEDLVISLGSQYKVAEKLGVSQGLISLVRHKAEYSPTVRTALGLPLLAMVPVCSVCGKIHTQLKTCDRVRKNRTYPPTLKIRRDDIHSAARSMIGNLEEDYLLDLLDLLDLFLKDKRQ